MPPWRRKHLLVCHDPESDAAYFRQGILRPHTWMLTAPQPPLDWRCRRPRDAVARARTGSRQRVWGDADSNFRVSTLPGPHSVYYQVS
eukprot:5924901-Prymnesium_polylepis.1